MHSLKASLIALTISVVPLLAKAQPIHWADWSFPNSQTATGSLTGLGTVDVSVKGDSNTVAPWSIRFSDPSVSLADVQSIGTGQKTFDVWSARLDLTSLSNTSGLIVGLGNFGHGLDIFPGYQLKAFDLAGATISLSGFSQIGSYDHTWISPSWPSAFNDNVTFDSSTGYFNVTKVLGANDINSDMLLLSLPANVGSLEVSTIAASAGETVNIMVGTLNTVSSVPEPSTIWLLAIVGTIWPLSSYRKLKSFKRVD